MRLNRFETALAYVVHPIGGIGLGVAVASILGATSPLLLAPAGAAGFLFGVRSVGWLKK